MGQVKGPRPKTDIQAVRQRAGFELMDRLGIRTDAERTEIETRQIRKNRLLAQAKALTKADA